MKCPVCQHEIKDGQVYCEKCGYEIQIVPEFEAELENNIIENMSEVIQELAPEEDEDFEIVDLEESVSYDEDYDDIYERPSVIGFLFKVIKKHIWVSLGVFAVLAIVCAVVVHNGIQEKQKNSYEYQYQQAQDCAKNGDYEKAVEYLQEALRLEVNHPDARMLMADYKVNLGDTGEAELIYKDLFNYADYVQDAYDKYIALLEEQERYLEICYCLEQCEVQEVRRNYNHYLAELPIFSISEGKYEDAQMLKISANTNGIIYYTTDGSAPDKSSSVYTGPIMLESGKYEIQAFFINEFGMESDVFSAVYEIAAELPNVPVVTPDGGDYTVPTYISVEVPKGCIVYYTTDGTTPDHNSLTYNREICMPLGNTTFKFVSYNNEYVPSEIIQVEYHLNLEGVGIDEFHAMLSTAEQLVQYGMLLNTNGQVAGANGLYSYRATAAFEYEGNWYYLMTEYYTDASGNTYPTQTKYAVGIKNAVLYKTNVDRNGHYTAISFQ